MTTTITHIATIARGLTVQDTDMLNARMSAHVQTMSQADIMSEAQLTRSLNQLAKDLHELRGEVHPKSFWATVHAKLLHDRYTMTKWNLAEPWILRGHRPYRRATSYSDFFPTRLQIEETGAHFVELVHHERVVRSTYKTACEDERRRIEETARKREQMKEADSEIPPNVQWEMKKLRTHIEDLQEELSRVNRTVHVKDLELKDLRAIVAAKDALLRASHEQLNQRQSVRARMRASVRSFMQDQFIHEHAAPQQDASAVDQNAETVKHV